jgi:uncharacterized protein with GYD domain
MARYLVQAIANPEQRVTHPDELAAWIQQVVERAGGRLEGLYYTIGDSDMVMLLDMPDDATEAAFVELGSSTGRFKVTSQAPLISPEDAAQATRKLTVASRDDVAMPRERELYVRPVPSASSGGPVQPAQGDTVYESVGRSQPPLEEQQPNGLPSPSMLATIGEMPPGSYELVAGRFTRFSELGAFSETLQALPGVNSVTIQQFLRGMVSMRIQYDSPIPLLTRLQELRQFKPEVRAIGPAQFELLIFSESRGATPPLPSERPGPAAGAPPRERPSTPETLPASERPDRLLHPADLHEADEHGGDGRPQGPTAWLTTGAATLVLSLLSILHHGKQLF